MGEKKFGGGKIDPAKQRSMNEKVTDKARGMFEKATGYVVHFIPFPLALLSPYLPSPYLPVGLPSYRLGRVSGVEVVAHGDTCVGRKSPRSSRTRWFSFLLFL